MPGSCVPCRPKNARMAMLVGTCATIEAGVLFVDKIDTENPLRVAPTPRRVREPGRLIYI